jgi:branched-chain amino acid transport system ATP-binding protein
LLVINNLVVKYGKALALNGVSLKVSEGEVLALVGSNGAGKTTLLNTISGLLRPTAGDVIFEGCSLIRVAPNNIVKLGLCQCPENRHIATDMTVEETLNLGAYLRSDRDSIRADLSKVYELFPRLKERRKSLAGTLSGGERQMLSIGRSLMTKPRLLMLDEPSLGLAPLIKEDIATTINEVNRFGVTILLVEQDARMALRLAKRAYVLEVGQVIKTGEAGALLRDQEFTSLYLGM